MHHSRRRSAPWQSAVTAWGLLWLSVSLLAGVTASAAPSPLEVPPDRIRVEKRNAVLELSWSDTEERLQGSIQPDSPREGDPLKVQVNVGSFDGAAFDGPVTLTLREAGSQYGQVVTVKREKGAVNWRAEFTPQATGVHQLDVSFRTTHNKVLHADIEVLPSLVPRYFLWAIVGLAALMGMGYGVRNLLRKEPPSAPAPISAEPPSSTQPPSGTQPPGPAL